MKPRRRGLRQRAIGDRRAVATAGLFVVVLVVFLSGCTADTAPVATTPPPTAATSGSSPGSSPTGSAAVPVTIALPDPHLTPGEAFAGVTSAEVCTPGWASSHRAVASAQYREVYGAYGVTYPEPSGTYELDHLIPLEIGGDNANANLWPEPAAPTPGFHQKDELENALHDRVCAGSLGLV